MYEQILYEVDDPVATITLNRPESLNGWTGRMGAEVRHAAAQAAADPAVVGIVVTGAGRGFCAGADMKTLSSLSSGEGGGGGLEDLSALDADPRDPSFGPDFAGEYTYFMAIPKPVVAAINGPVAGMGVPIALSADLRFMSEDAVLLTAFAQRGLIAEWGLGWLLPRLTGSAVALDLLFSSRKVPADECVRLGLANAALPGDQLVEHCKDYIRGLAQRSSPASMAVMKRQVYADLHKGLGDAELEARRLMRESFDRPDFAEGVRSFLEKRPPQFPRLGA